MRTAILVDAAFYIERYKVLFSQKNYTPKEAAKKLHNACLRHLRSGKGNNSGQDSLYRILVYDCPPLEKRLHLPVSKKSINFAKSKTAIFRKEFHDELRKLRKVALRLGELRSSGSAWLMKPAVSKELIARAKGIDDLKDADFAPSVRQKGVDMKIGLDIAALALKQQVGKIVLIAGDSDFVPAAKMARREGIDFILDPMWHRTTPSLMEHIDGLYSHFPKPKNLKSKSRVISS